MLNGKTLIYDQGSFIFVTSFCCTIYVVKYIYTCIVNYFVHYIYSLSAAGRVIALAIHQPRYSIFKLFDSLTLLSNGELVYHGPAASALDYFGRIG